MPGRKYEAGNGYRYGFNGKENDNEVKGEGNQQDYGIRIYDPRIGRWFSTDAIVKHYLSPYNFGQDNPINLIDPDGGDEIHFYYTSTYHMLSNGRMTLNSPRITMTVKVIPKDGPDEFFYHKVKQVFKIQPASTENGKLPLGVNLKPTWVQTENKSDPPIRFYPSSDGPNGQGGFMRGTGITTSAGGLPFVSRNDEDYTSLAKIAPDDLVSYLEKKDPKHFGGLGTHKAFLQLAQGIQNAINFTVVLGELGSFVFTSASEALAARTLFLEEGKVQGAHFLSRHGAQTSLEEQLKRAMTGFTPDNVQKGAVNSTRFLSNDAQLEAFNKAKALYQKGMSSAVIDMGKIVGEGYYKGGETYGTATQVQVYYNSSGGITTLFPLLPKK